MVEVTRRTVAETWCDSGARRVHVVAILDGRPGRWRELQLLYRVSCDGRELSLGFMCDRWSANTWDHHRVVASVADRAAALWAARSIVMVPERPEGGVISAPDVDGWRYDRPFLNMDREVFRGAVIDSLRGVDVRSSLVSIPQPREVGVREPEAGS